MDISEIKINENVIDNDETIHLIIGKTSNSIEILLYKKTSKGVNCRQWFTIEQFNKRFRIKK